MGMRRYASVLPPAKPSRADAARWQACQNRIRQSASGTTRIQAYLEYLEAYPTGAYNRRAAEEIEFLLDEMTDRNSHFYLRCRYRSIRNAVMPEIHPDTWRLPHPGF